MTNKQRIEYANEILRANEKDMVALEKSLYFWEQSSDNVLKAKLDRRSGSLPSLFGGQDEKLDIKKERKEFVTRTKAKLREDKADMKLLKEYIESLSPKK